MLQIYKELSRLRLQFCSGKSPWSDLSLFVILYTLNLSIFLGVEKASRGLYGIDSPCKEPLRHVKDLQWKGQMKHVDIHSKKYLKALSSLYLFPEQIILFVVPGPMFSLQHIWRWI